MSANTENNYRIAKNTLMLYIRMFLIMAVRLYSSRVILDVLGIVDYGLYNVIGGMVVLFTFINNAMTDSTQRFLTFELGKGDIERLGIVFRTSRMIHWCLALLFFVLIELFGIWFISTQMTIPAERIDACYWVMHFSVLTTMIKIVSVPYNSLIIAHERMNVFAIISIIDAFVLLLILFILPLVDNDKLITYGILVFVEQAILQLTYRVYCRKAFQECSIKSSLERSKSIEMIKFASWNICGNMAQLVSSHGLNMLLNVFFNPAINAARGVAVTVQGAVGQFSGSFQSALNPQITKSYAKHDFSYMNQLIFNSSKYTYLLLLFISLPIFFQAEFILDLWLVDVPENAAVFLRLILCCTILEAIVNPVNVAVAATGQIKKYQLYNGIINMAIIPIACIAFWFGLSSTYAFVIQLALSLLSLFARLSIMQQILNFKIQTFVKDVLLKCLLVAGTSILLPVFCANILVGRTTLFVIVTTACLISVLFSAFFVGLGKNERNVIIQYIRSKY